MKFPFHVYLDKLEGVAKAALADRPGLWQSPVAPLQSLRRVIVRPFANLSDEVVIAQGVPPTAMRHIIESQPRVMIALIGMIRVLVERVAQHEGDLRKAHALLNRARRWVPDPRLGDEIESVLRLPGGTARLEVEVGDEGLRSLDCEIEEPQ